MKASPKLVIDFLYLDLSSCARCKTTDQILDEALIGLRGKLPSNVTVNKIQVSKDEVDASFRSPTIRINGKDIEEILHKEFNIKRHQKDNYCGQCSDICGEETQCRVYEYKGKNHDALPKLMIQEAIAKVGGFELSSEQTQKSDLSCTTNRCKDGDVAKPKVAGCGCD